MELRKRTQTPRRFGDDDEFKSTEHRREQRRQPTSSTSRHTFEIPPLIDYNPNLPPAAFPTMSLGEARKSGADVPGANVSELQEQLSGIDRRVRQRPSSIPESHACEPVQPTEQPNLPKMAPPLRDGGLNFRPDTMLSNHAEPGEETEGGRLSNGPLNPVWVSNIKIMEKLDERTDQDWIIAEMETSDEEEAPRVQHKEKATTAECPKWEELSVAHQVDMVTTLLDSYETREEAMQQLRLNFVQKKRMIQLLGRDQELETAKNEGSKTFRDETNRILMTGDDDGSRHISQAKYSELASKYLDRFVQGEGDFHMTTPAELEKAERYFKFCGQDPKLLDHWANPYDRGTMSPSSTKPKLRTKSLQSTISDRQTSTVSRTDKPPETAARPLPNIRVTMATKSTHPQSVSSSASLAANIGGISNEPQSALAENATTQECSTPTTAPQSQEFQVSPLNQAATLKLRNTRKRNASRERSESHSRKTSTRSGGIRSMAQQRTMVEGMQNHNVDKSTKAPLPPNTASLQPKPTTSIPAASLASGSPARNKRAKRTPAPAPVRNTRKLRAGKS